MLVRELVLVLLVALPLVAVSFSLADGSLEVNKSTLEPRTLSCKCFQQCTVPTIICSPCFTMQFNLVKIMLGHLVLGNIGSEGRVAGSLVLFW